jgi:hypothetical protein
MGEIRNSYKFLTRKPERQKLLGRHRRKLEDNIKMNHRRTLGWAGFF